MGEDPASIIYVEAKTKAALDVGIRSFQHALPQNTSSGDLLEHLVTLNNTPECNGILLQLPLPVTLDPQEILLKLAPEKDVDGLHPHNIGLLWAGALGLQPCTPLGCIDLLKTNLGPDGLEGKHCVVLGRSNLVGKPLSALLLRENATVTMAHSKTRELPALLHSGDVIISAMGNPNFVQGSWIKPGATIIDVGITRTERGLLGDVDFESCQGIARAITPVPGGVGPMTVAYLLYNTLKACLLQNKCSLKYLP